MDKSRLESQRRKRQPCRHPNQLTPMSQILSWKANWLSSIGKDRTKQMLTSHLDHVMGVP